MVFDPLLVIQVPLGAWLLSDVSYSDECRTKKYFQYAKIQSLPKVLEHLQYFLDHLINTALFPSEQCWFMEDIHAAHTSIYVEITLIDVSVQLNIVLRGEGMVILCFRPET